MSIEEMTRLADLAEKLALELKKGDPVKFRTKHTKLRGYGTLTLVFWAMDALAFKVKVHGVMNGEVNLIPELGDHIKKVDELPKER